jgi:hypothetical protein
MARNFETPTRVWCSAWTASAHVTRADSEDYSRMPRVRLDADRDGGPRRPPEIGPLRRPHCRDIPRPDERLLLVLAAVQQTTVTVLLRAAGGAASGQDRGCVPQSKCVD